MYDWYLQLPEETFPIPEGRTGSSFLLELAIIGLFLIIHPILKHKPSYAFFAEALAAQG